MSNNRKPNAKVLLVGKSGSGKDTVQDYLVSKYGLKPLLSYTTRKKRFSEENTHTFITVQEYEDLKRHEEIIAYTFYNGNHYFATKKQFEEADIYIIDLDGVEYISKLNLELETPYIVIYLDVPEDIRRQRMEARNDDTTAIEERLQYDEDAFREINRWCNYSIQNLDSEETAESIAKMIGVAKYDHSELDCEREIVCKLSQIQTLLRSIAPDMDCVSIWLSNCGEVPLQYGNNYYIQCSGKEDLTAATITTSDENNIKNLIRAAYGLPNKPHVDIQTVRID
jgi:guanylate kinase